MTSNTATETYRIIQTVWKTAQADIKYVREQVFIKEQGIPAHSEWEARDRDCIHILAYNHSGKPIGTARLLATGRIGRMAVLASWRNNGVGRAMLKCLVNIGRKKTHMNLCLHAQIHAIPFYRQFGFEEQGPVFEEAGIPHRLMHLTTPKLPNESNKDER